jgi:hypothetical protein
MILMMNGIEALVAVNDRPRHLWLGTETDASEWISVAVTDVGVARQSAESSGCSTLFSPPSRVGWALVGTHR